MTPNQLFAATTSTTPVNAPWIVTSLTEPQTATDRIQNPVCCCLVVVVDVDVVDMVVCVVVLCQTSYSVGANGNLSGSKSFRIAGSGTYSEDQKHPELKTKC